MKRSSTSRVLAGSSSAAVAESETTATAVHMKIRAIAAAIHLEYLRVFVLLMFSPK